MSDSQKVILCFNCSEICRPDYSTTCKMKKGVSVAVFVLVSNRAFLVQLKVCKTHEFVAVCRTSAFANFGHETLSERDEIVSTLMYSII